MNDLTAKAREVFDSDRYATETTGIVIEHADSHETVCTLEVTEQHCNARNVAMGGVLFTLADFAAAVAANMSDERLLSTHHSSLRWVSLNASIHYLSPAPKGAHLHATCKALKQGRTTALYQTIIESPDNGNKTIAIVETTMISL